MTEYIGNVFPAVISGVTGWGIYVQLENTVEGLVHVNSMDEYYKYSESTQTLTGKKSCKVYRLGDPVRVQVTKVNTFERTIDFRLVLDKKERENEKRARKAHRK